MAGLRDTPDACVPQHPFPGTVSFSPTSSCCSHRFLSSSPAHLYRLPPPTVPAEHPHWLLLGSPATSRGLVTPPANSKEATRLSSASERRGVTTYRLRGARDPRQAESHATRLDTATATAAGAEDGTTEGITTTATTTTLNHSLIHLLTSFRILLPLPHETTLLPPSYLPQHTIQHPTHPPPPHLPQYHPIIAPIPTSHLLPISHPHHTHALTSSSLPPPPQ